MGRPVADKPALIDSLLRSGRRAQDRGDLFGAQRSLDQALQAAHQTEDYERMAEAVRALGQVREAIRESATKSRRVAVVDERIPQGRDLKPGCYLVQPPRVGVDGRTLRELAAAAGIPALVVVREPTTRAGLWPVVALGPITVRTRVKPPGAAGKGGTSGGVKKSAGKPTPTWMKGAIEALGEAAVEGAPQAPASVRVAALLERLGTVPESSILHETLHEACLAAAKNGRA